MIGARKTGNWDKVKRTVNRLNTAGKEAQRRFLKEWGLKCIEVVRGHIDSQDLPWTPLSPKTALYKANHGYSDNIYIMTGAYRGNLVSWVDGRSVKVGVKAGSTSIGGASLDQIAMMLEYGTSKVPARPLWEPSYNEMLVWMGNIDPGNFVIEILNKA